MTTTYFAARPSVQESMEDTKQHVREIARVVNSLVRGQDGSSMSVTLTPSAATTSIIDSRISLQTCVSMMPTTADAAAALATTYITCAAGVATINHANNTQSDRTFTVSIHG